MGEMRTIKQNVEMLLLYTYTITFIVSVIGDCLVLGGYNRNDKVLWWGIVINGICLGVIAVCLFFASIIGLCDRCYHKYHTIPEI